MSGNQQHSSENQSEPSQKPPPIRPDRESARFKSAFEIAKTIWRFNTENGVYIEFDGRCYTPREAVLEDIISSRELHAVVKQNAKIEKLVQETVATLACYEASPVPTKNAGWSFV